MNQDIFFDVMRSQLLAQAAWYDLSSKDRRQAVTKLVADQFLMMQHQLETECFLEIGAHEAGFSRHVCKEYPDARVYAFEANPHVYRRYAESLATDFPAIDYRNIAVGATNGMVDFWLVTGLEGKEESLAGKRSSLLHRVDDSSKTIVESLQSITLDTFVKQEHLSGKNLCLWIDVEGATGLVLEGATATLPSITSLFIEVEIKTVWENQWSFRTLVNWLYEHDFVPVLRDFQYAKQFNCAFIRKDCLGKVEFDLSLYIQRSVRQRIQALTGLPVL